MNPQWSVPGYGVSFQGPNTGLLGKADCNTKQTPHRDAKCNPNPHSHRNTDNELSN